MLKVLTQKKENTLFKDVAQVLFATFFLAIFAKVHIYLFFTPVPISLQNSIAISYGCFLGSKKGALSVLLFILIGALGAPVFTNGNFGISYLLSTTFGYVISYAISGFVVGKILETFKSSKYEINAMDNKSWFKRFAFQHRIFLTVLLGHGIVIFGGALYLSALLGVKKAVLLGVLPFILGDMFKSVIICKAIQLKNRFYTN